MRIEQNSNFLKDLVNDVVRGRLVPAAFQRPYVWGKADVLALCESILEGYPIGSFLIWEPHGATDLNVYARDRLGPILRAPGSIASGLLLDGQNRLATFAWMTSRATELPPEVASDLSDAERATWASGEVLVVDLATREIRFVPQADAEKGLTLPASALLGGSEVMALIRQRWNGEGWSAFPEAERNEGLKWWDETASARFSDARLIATTLERASVEDARKAFAHICRVGVPISAEDLDAALQWNGDR